MQILIRLLRLLSLLPLSALRRLGSLLGFAGWFCASRMVATTRVNIALCFPDLSQSAQESLARRSIRESFRTMTETSAVWLWPGVRILNEIRHVDGLPLLQDAHAGGHGVIVISPHLGNWELMGLYLNTCGCGPTSQLYQPPSDPAVARLLFQARSRSGANMVASDRRGVGMLLEALRRGEIIGILPDQVPPESGGEFSRFFGVDALTMTLVSRLLMKTGARILLGYARRVAQPRAGFEICFREMPMAIYSRDLHQSLMALNLGIEAAVREVPEQYHWEYKRFKRQPPGLPKIYDAG
ncbi:MAG: lysophospholipid acyltransferase family protein [Pseudomonadales bacterium]|nr:lysophospholipid acyltransferase family protein [Pseudomonadales bacterium]